MKTENPNLSLAKSFSYQTLIKAVVILGSVGLGFLALGSLSASVKELSSFIFLIPILFASVWLSKKHSLIFVVTLAVLSLWLLTLLETNFNYVTFGLSYLVMFSSSLIVSHLSADLREANKLVNTKTKAEEFLVESIENSDEFEKEINEERDSLDSRVDEETKDLEEERNRLEASINSLNVGFIITDTKNQIVNLNSTAKRLLCITENSGSRAGGMIVDPLAFNLKCDLDTIAKQLEGKFDLKNNLDVCFKERKMVDIGNIDFRDLVIHIFMSPIVMFKDSALKVIGTVILIEDITKEKVLERSRDEFFSIASHELRTPLTSIRGNTSLIKQYYGEKLKGDKDLTEMIDDIHSSSIRLIEIVNDFLDTSRLEQGRITFNKTEFEFKDLAEEVIKEMMALAKQKNLYLKLEIEALDLKVIADRDRCKQILINLVGNSLKFTEVGGVKLILENEDNFLRVLVSDSGRGIDSKNQKLLFRKFQQASSSLLTRDTAKGTGLGLYISKLMIEGMGGKIGLGESGLGKGSIFIFTLPLVNPEGEAKK